MVISTYAFHLSVVQDGMEWFAVATPAERPAAGRERVGAPSGSPGYIILLL